MGKLAIAIARKMPPPGEDASAHDEPDGDEGAGEEDKGAEESAAEQFQHAVKNGSPADVVEAYRNLKEACEDAEGY